MSEPAITEFRGEYRFLSSFWPCRVAYNGHWYTSVEHAYQAAKCADVRDEVTIRQASSPGLAKRLGNSVDIRSDWESVKLEIMAGLLWKKFILIPKLRAQLAATGDRELVEGNTWGDTCWGVCEGKGTNHLGNLLMRVREMARYLEENRPAAPTVVKDDGRQS